MRGEIESGKAVGWSAYIVRWATVWCARWCVAGIFLSGLGAGYAWAERPTKLVRVRVPDVADPAVVQFLRAGPDVAGYDAASRTLFVLTRPRDVALLDSLRLPYEVEIPDLAIFESHLRQSGYFEHFHDYGECKSELQWAERSYPGIAKVYDLGDSWEKTQRLADRDILAIKISDNVETEEDEPRVAIVANHHAREIITPEIAIFLIHYLLERYGKDPYITYLVNQRQIWILPTLNPDGLDYVHRFDRWWRKNRRRNANGTYGVDLNRNYGFMWGFDDVGSSPEPSSEVYRGEAPFSEPETQAFRDLCLREPFRIVLSLHSFGRLVLFPWGYIPENTPDHEVFRALADSMVGYNRYTPRNAASGVIYLTNGEACDWLYGEQELKTKMFGFTLEVGTSFHPDTSQIRSLILETLGPLLYAIWAAGEEPIVEVQPLPDTEDEDGPFIVRARVRPPIPLTGPSGLDPSSLWLHYAAGNAPFDSTVLHPVGGDEYVGVIPASPGCRSYRYYLTARTSGGRRGAAPRCAPDSVFEFHVRPDTLGPTIVHRPSVQRSAFDAAFPIRAWIHDVAGVDSAWVEYRTDEWILFTVGLTDRGEGEFAGSLTLPHPRAWQTVWYRIVARDGSRRKNVAVAPDTGWYRFQLVPDRILDFEDDPGLTVTSDRQWEWGVPTTGPGSAHSGMRVWATRLNGTYGDNADARLETPPIDLTHAEAATFRFWHWYQFEYSDGKLWDGGNVKISVDRGPFQVLLTSLRGYDGWVDRYNSALGGEPAFGGPPGTGNSWRLETFDLSPFVGHTVVLQFHFGSDGYVQDYGWYLDDVAWTVHARGAPSLTLLTLPRNTPDTEGPYPVEAQITDDGRIARAEIVRRNGPRWDRIPMVGQGSRYIGWLPGQPLGTRVEFYLEVADDQGNVVREPLAAPEATFSFWVTNDGPTPRVWPDSLCFEVSDPGSSLLQDSLWIANEGLLDLLVRVEPEPGLSTRPSGEAGSQKCSKAIALESFTGVPEPWAKGKLPAWPSERGVGASHPGPAVHLSDGYAFLACVAPCTLVMRTWPGAESFVVKCEKEQVALGSLEEKRWLVTVPAETRDGLTRVVLPQSVLGRDWRVLHIGQVGTEEERIESAVATRRGSWLFAFPDSAMVPHGGRLCVRVRVDCGQIKALPARGYVRLRMNVPGAEEKTIPVVVEARTPSVAKTEGQAVPEGFGLAPCFPNPFNAETVVRYWVPEAARAELVIADARGRRVRLLGGGEVAPGTHLVRWDGKADSGEELPSGIYLCRLQVWDRHGALRWAGAQKILLLR
ncbi:MAG: M14 family zinc carboxypeptidase [candidate division KSB1 bacterium]|nr:M14 family zinc carboxypeptidase [candidate division KSB1 bacterium]